MKNKIFTIFFSIVVSVSAFASRDVVPTDADLANYYNQGDACVCFYVPIEIDCNNIVVTGSFNNWSSNVAMCAAVEPVEGYSGWYVTSFTPEAEPDATKGIQIKPIMLTVIGAFNWNYQVGAATAIRGGVQVAPGAYSGEIDLIHFGTDAPNVFAVDGWKENPCTVVFHNYTVTVISDGCDGLVIPFIVGGMNNWRFQQMQIDVAKSLENNAPTYSISFTAAEGTAYQIVSGGMDPVTGLVDSTAMPEWSDIAYIQKYDAENDSWVRYKGADGDNQLTYETTNIIYDLRADTLRWARCGGLRLLSVSCDNTKGVVTGSGEYEYGSQVTFSAVPNGGYHFTQWNDSVTDNPRTIQLTQDTTFTAFFEIDSFYVSISCDTLKGSVDRINGLYPYGAQLNISATPKYGYHFDHWSDNRYQNPRSLTITSNTNLTALFAKNSYYVYGTTNPNKGMVSGTGSFLYEDYCTIRAVPNYGYHFVQWSDSVIENPRSFILTQDTTFTAEFAVDTAGLCGKDYALKWVYNDVAKTLVISGDGSFDQNMSYGVQAKSNMTQLVIQEGVTTIGESAFAGCDALTTISLPTSLKRIGDYAFQNCLDLSAIYNHRATPCVISTNTFDAVNIFDCTLYVPAGSVVMYKHEASNWHIFYNIDTFGEDTISLYMVNYLDKDSVNLANEIIKLHFPEAPEIEGFTFIGWRPIPSIIVDGIAVQAVYESNQPESAPEVVTNPANPAQKLIRNGSVYILVDEKVYTLQGQLVK